MAVYRSSFNRSTTIMPGMGVMSSLETDLTRGWCVRVRFKSPLWGIADPGWVDFFKDRATANAAFESVQLNPDEAVRRHLGEQNA